MAATLAAITVTVADVVREQHATCDVDQEVSFLQHSKNWRQRGASSHRAGSLQAPRGEWFMSPDIAALCDPNFVVLPVSGTPVEPTGSQGVSAMPSACKKCVDDLGQELDYKYEYLVSTAAFETVSLCADGPFSGCLSCTMTTWVADEWGPKLGSCCNMEDASTDCSSHLAEFQARNAGQKAEACSVSSLSDSSSAPSPSAPAANATDNSTAGSANKSTASPAANSTDSPTPGDLGEDAAPLPGDDATPAPVLGEDAAPSPALGEDAAPAPAPVLGEDAAPAPVPAPVLGEDAAPTPVTEDSPDDSTTSAAEPTDSAAASATESTDTSALATDGVNADTTTTPAAEAANTSAADTSDDSAADSTAVPAA